MKRIFPVLMSLVLVFSLIAVPAQAAESYVFTADDLGFCHCPSALPEGIYEVSCVSPDGESYSFGSAVVTYTYLSKSDTMDLEPGYYSFLILAEGDGGVFLLFVPETKSSSMFCLMDDFDYLVGFQFLFEPVASLDDSYVVSACNRTTMSSSYIPEGSYSVYCSVAVQSLLGSLPVSVQYQENSEWDYISSHSFSLCGTAGSFSVGRYNGTDSIYLETEVVSAGEPVTFYFLPLDPPSSSVPSLSGIVDSGMLTGALDQVVSILPVLLVAIVSFIGIRKGISWLQNVLHGA